MRMGTNDGDAQDSPGEQQTVEKGFVFLDSAVTTDDCEIPAPNPEEVGPSTPLEPPNEKRAVQTSPFDVNEPVRNRHRPPVPQPKRRDQPKHRAAKDNSLSSSETLLDGPRPTKGQRAARLGRRGSAKLGSLPSLVHSRLLVPACVVLVAVLIACAILPVNPLCSFPLLSGASKCKTEIPIPDMPFTRLMNVQKELLPVMEAAGSGSNLALHFKRVEMKISDLNALVQLSTIENKVPISSSLRRFEELARKSSKYLSRLQSNVEGVANAFLAADDYVLRTLEEIEHQKETGSGLLAVFSPVSASPASHEKLLETFNYMADVMEGELGELMEATVVTTITLDQLQAEMKSIFYLVTQQKGKTKDDEDKTLAHLWTQVGGNRAKLARYEGHYELLSQIEGHRSTAKSKVSEAQVKLEKLDQDLQRLRTRVAAPISPYEPRISLEKHIENLRKGVEVLTEARSEARRKEDQIVESIADRRKYTRLESQ